MSRQESPIIPSIGRVVWVRGEAVLSREATREVPGIITQVRNLNLIDVVVFGGDQVVYEHTQAIYNDDEPGVRDLAWRWPVHQKQPGVVSAVHPEPKDPHQGPVPSTPLDRVLTERYELAEKMSKLSAFVQTENFRDLPMAHKRLLSKQGGVMEQYLMILSERISLMQLGEG